MFLNKSFFNQIVLNFFKSNNIENVDINDIKDTPGIYIRKYFYNLDNDLENLKKNNEEFFYKIISERIINKFKNNHVQILKKIKFNLLLKNDMNKLITELK